MLTAYLTVYDSLFLLYPVEVINAIGRLGERPRDDEEI
jgi:hypothetical protein